VKGSCLCGGVGFEVTEDFLSVTACHCTNCKKISGSGGTVSGRAKTSTISVFQGEELLRNYTPPEGTAKTFCSVCGSNIFGGGWPEAEQVSVRLSTLDEPCDRRPEWRIYVRSVAPWETLPDDGSKHWNPPD
jgi:hypothetical protein